MCASQYVYGGVITTDVGLVHGGRCNIVKLVILIIVFYLREVLTLTRCFVSFTYLFNSLNLISNEPITFYQLSECRYGQVGLLTFKPSIKMGNKGDLSNFKYSTVVGARQFGISDTSGLLGFSHPAVSPVKGLKQRKCQFSG